MMQISPSGHKDPYQPSITFPMSSLADQYMHCIADILIKWSVRIRSQVAARPHCSRMWTNHREQTTYICSRRRSHVGNYSACMHCAFKVLKHETNRAQSSRGIFNHLGGYFCEPATVN